MKKINVLLQKIVQSILDCDAVLFCFSMSTIITVDGEEYEVPVSEDVDKMLFSDGIGRYK